MPLHGHLSSHYPPPPLSLKAEAHKNERDESHGEIVLGTRTAADAARDFEANQLSVEAVTVVRAGSGKVPWLSLVEIDAARLREEVRTKEGLRREWKNLVGVEILETLFRIATPTLRTVALVCALPVLNRLPPPF